MGGMETGDEITRTSERDLRAVARASEGVAVGQSDQSSTGKLRRVMVDSRAPFLPKGGGWIDWGQGGSGGGDRMGPACGEKWAERHSLAVRFLPSPFRMAYSIFLDAGQGLQKGRPSVVPCLLSVSVPSALVFAANDAAAPGLHTFSQQWKTSMDTSAFEAPASMAGLLTSSLLRRCS
jgi:hypothetical protein